jgi:hypothetical protein
MKCRLDFGLQSRNNRLHIVGDSMKVIFPCLPLDLFFPAQSRAGTLKQPFSPQPWNLGAVFMP